MVDVLPEIPEIEPSEVDRIVNEDPEFMNYLKDFENFLDQGFDPTSTTEGIDKYFNDLEAKGETTINRLVVEILVTMDVKVVNASDVSATVNPLVDNVSVSPETVKTAENVIQDKTPTPEEVAKVTTEAKTEATKTADAIANEPDPVKQKAAQVTDQLARDTIENMAKKTPPLEGGWSSVLQQLARWLITILGTVSILGLGIYYLKLLAKAMSGCCLYYDKTKYVKLVCDSEYDYATKEDLRPYCTCLASNQVKGCTGAYVLFDQSSLLGDIRNTCNEADRESDSCLYDNVFRLNPICALANNHCYDTLPLVCDLDGRTVYYSFQEWNWGSLLSNIVNNWPNLFNDPATAFQKLIRFLIFAFIVIVVIIISYNFSKVIFKKLTYRVENNQKKYLQQHKGTIVAPPSKKSKKK